MKITLKELRSLIRESVRAALRENEGKPEGFIAKLTPAQQKFLSSLISGTASSQYENRRKEYDELISGIKAEMEKSGITASQLGPVGSAVYVALSDGKPRLVGSPAATAAEAAALGFGGGDGGYGGGGDRTDPRASGGGGGTGR